MSIEFRRGWVPTPAARPRVRLTAALRADVAPPAVNFGSGLPVIGMHDNDIYGCCVLAADANIVQQQTYFGQQTEVTVPDSEVLTAYEVVGGYNPNAGPPGNNPTDNGAQIADGLAYLKNTGMSGHKIAAYGQVDVTATDKLKTAIWEFGGLSIGVNLPNSAIAQFNTGLPWTVDPANGTIAGGHCVYCNGYDAEGFTFWTWGKLWHMDYAFWNLYCEEAWSPVSTDWVNATSGKDPEGVDLVTLGAEFMAITGQDPFPVPSPAPSPPSPPSVSQPVSSLVPPSVSSPPSSGFLSRLAKVISRLRYGV